MTKMIKSFLSVTVIALLLSSCAVTNSRNIRTGTTTPNDVRLIMTLDDYEFLGDTEIEVEYHRYLGIISYLNTVNGAPVTNNANYVYLKGKEPIRLGSRHLNRALIKAYKAYPNADFLMPAMSEVEIQQMFLGRKITAKAKIKAYKIRK